MVLQVGEWVKTESGEVGKVIHASRLTVVVALPNPPKPVRVEAMNDESLPSGVWVRTHTGDVGQIIFASRLSAFVDIQKDKSSYTATFLLKELTTIDEPQHDDGE
jgi:hypothetical protein